MDADHFHCLMGLAVLEREKLESITDGQGSGEGLGGVELPLSSHKVVEKGCSMNISPNTAYSQWLPSHLARCPYFIGEFIEQPVG